MKQSDTVERTDRPMSMGEHLQELRKRLFMSLLGYAVCVVFCLYFGREIISLMKQAYSQIMIAEKLKPDLQTLSPGDGFTAFVQIALLNGVLLSAPWLFWQGWKFLSVGLYPKERKIVSLLSPLAAGLFIAGAWFSFVYVIPLTIQFFVVFNRDYLGVESYFTFENYISYMSSLVLVFGMSFQLPLMVLTFNSVGLVSMKQLKAYRKIAFFLIVVVATVVTPPDVISQIALGLPLYGLYEAGILLCYVFNRKLGKV